MVIAFIAVDHGNGRHLEALTQEQQEKVVFWTLVGFPFGILSFGLPKRKLVNDVFLRLAIDHGADSGIVDPVQSKISEVMELDMESKPVKIATDMLMGQDEYCVKYIAAFRAGELE